MSSATAAAATVRVQSAPSSIAVGEMGTVQVVLELEQGEEASLFEGHFALSGAGSANAEVIAGGVGWSSSYGRVGPAPEGRLGPTSVDVSLTSMNDAGTRVVATLQLTGLAAGPLNILFDGASFAAYDSTSAPFLGNVPLGTTPGEPLATIDITGSPSMAVAALPAGFAAVLSGLLLLAGSMSARSRRRRSARVDRSGPSANMA